MSTRAEASITTPLPATGTLEFTDNGRVKLSMEIDIAKEIARGLVTGQLRDLSDLTHRTFIALMVELAIKGGHQPSPAAMDAAGHAKH